jgi:hypothetical protein
MPSKDIDRLQLAELLDFRPDLGVIRLHDQRVVILSAAALGLMKKELIDTVDHGRIRGTLGAEETDVGATTTLNKAAARGVDVGAIAEQLQIDGIEAFCVVIRTIDRHREHQAA